MASILLSSPGAPMQGERPDQQETIQAIRGAQLGGFQVKTATFEVRNQRLDAPATAVIPHGRFRG